MIVAVVKTDGVLAQRSFGERTRGRLELAAVNQDFTFRADEEYTATIAVEDFHAIGVNVAQALDGLGILQRNNLDGPAIVHTQTPLGNVEVVRPPICHHAARILPVVAPVREVFVHAARAKH